MMKRKHVVITLSAVLMLLSLTLFAAPPLLGGQKKFTTGLDLVITETAGTTTYKYDWVSDITFDLFEVKNTWCPVNVLEWRGGTEFLLYPCLPGCHSIKMAFQTHLIYDPQFQTSIMFTIEGQTYQLNLHTPDWSQRFKNLLLTQSFHVDLPSREGKKLKAVIYLVGPEILGF